jgi:RHS repeat-associated protein
VKKYRVGISRSDFALYPTARKPRQNDVQHSSRAYLLLVFTRPITSALVASSRAQLVLRKNQQGPLSFERDVLGRVVRKRQSDFLAYDAAGQRVEYRTGDGLQVTHAYDNDARLQQVAVRGNHPNGLLWVTRIEHGAAVHFKAQWFPGDLGVQWSYGSSETLDTRSTRRVTDVVHSTRYQWRRLDQIAAMFDTASGASQFEHDAREYLVKALWQERGEQHRAHDAVGNLYETATRNDRVYGPGGVIQRTRDAVFKHARSGERTEKTTTRGEISRYEWNAAHELTTVVRPDGQRVEFRYDALGRRLEKRFAGAVTRFGWDGDDMIAERADGAEVVQWVFGEGYAPVLRAQGTRRHAVVSDHLDTPTALYDEAGKLAWRMQLDLYGVASVEGDATLCAWRWPGQWEDAETGLYYNRFRYYDPGAGTYISSDPIGLEGGLSLFGYASDPLTWVDPLGLIKCKGTRGAAAKALEAAMRMIGMNTHYKKHAAHHIVLFEASKGPRGQFARQSRGVLRKFGIHINDADNGVFLPTANHPSGPATRHQVVHTKTYTQAVRNRLQAAASTPGATRATIQHELGQIRTELENGVFPY